MTYLTEDVIKELVEKNDHEVVEMIKDFVARSKNADFSAPCPCCGMVKDRKNVTVLRTPRIT